MAIRREAPARNLCPCTIAILLRGWCADPPPVPCADDTHGHGTFFDLYEPDDAGFVRLWRENPSYLRAVANQWGWEPVDGPDGRRLFFAEAVAEGFEA